jgi:hypothetical protein
MASTVRIQTTTLAVRRAPSEAGVPVELNTLAREAGLHPDVVRRLIRLGLLESRGTAAAPRFPRDAAARLARASRLRRDLGLNYAGAVLVSDLLARIEDLEGRLRRYESSPDHRR